MKFHPLFLITGSLFLIVSGVFAPLFLSLFDVNSEIWTHLWIFVLPEALSNSLQLVFFVVLGTSFLGITLSWFCTFVSFPGQQWAKSFLILPLTVPGYVLAFVFLGISDSLGIFIPSFWGLILSMSLSLFPYIFLMSQVAFVNFSKTHGEVAEILGASPYKQFLKLQLPMAFPWILSGVLIVSMEALSDFGTVAVFNVSTLSTAIYKSWFDFFSWKAAAQLSLVLLIFTILFFRFESLLNQKKYNSDFLERKEIEQKPWLSFLAGSYVYLIIFISFILPLVQLIYWTLNTEHILSLSRYIKSSLILGSLGGLLLLVVSVLATFSLRKINKPLNRFFIGVSSLGYAMPGTVLAVGILIFFNFFGFSSGVFWLSFSALLVAYLVRFFLLSYRSSLNALGQVDIQWPEAAQTLGATSLHNFKRIYAPLIWRGLGVSFVLAFVEIIKEMPITLMLRPFQWDTLAVKVFELTSEGEWEKASLPALCIIVIGVIPVLLINQRKNLKVKP